MSVATSASRSVTALNPLVALLRDHPALLGTLSLQSATLTVPEAAQSFVLAGIAQGSRRTPLVVVVATTAEADRVAADLSTLLGEDQVDLFPAWETLPFERVSPSVETMGRRMRTMWHLQDPDRAPAVLVASARALVQRLGPHVEDVEPIVMTRGERCDQTEFLNALIAAGYRREYQVEHRGDVAVRGSIIDVFGSTDDEPIRIDLWGDEIERLTTFSVSDQRSDRDLDRVELFPCRELLPTDAVRARAQALMASAPWGSEQWQRLADGETFDGMESWLPWLADDGGDAAEHVLLDLLDERAQIVLLEPRRIRSRASEILLEEVDLAASLATTWGADSSSELPRLHQDFDRLLTRTSAAVWTMSSLAEVGSALVVSTLPWALAAGDGDQLTRQLSQLSAEKFRVVVAAETPSSAERIERVLRERGLGYSIVAEGGAALAEPGSRIAVASLQRGFILPDIKLAVLCETDFTGRRRTHRVPKASKRHAQTFFDDLAVGSYVVHHHHGVARFGGMVKRNIGGSERDYLLLEYRGEDRLYVPSDQIDAIRHYTGGDTPTLSKMGGSDFAKTKAKVRAEVATVAQELVVLYQTRMNSLGHAFGQDTPWQREMEEDFPFAETPDQLSAIAEVKADMEAEKPMDRLVIGDVGFGKTEVAIRAAFKACQDGFQVAVLVPTTLLAQQHYSTFAERFSPYPLRVEVLSRFLTNNEARTVIEGLASGEVDVVIGTHRLLSGGVVFKNLGLLVIDEEQRFGVSHKEAIKQFRTNVDVLTLTATPIPRTMEMSLTGIRDLSMLQTPPAARQPILTFVGEYDDRAVAEALRRELLREGQVFFVHNRVADIELKADQLRDLVPEAKIAVAHGQMDEGTLEQVVVDFWEGRFDVLVCTTIIESGIDMPMVNTLVVERADLLGLGQLHQLRGRVGRAGSRAYAYLFFPPDRELTEEAFERLRTIGEATELGSGFRIAMRDLEIRGAGNLLGTGQSGHIAAVGYDLYCSMVNEAIQELNGEKKSAPAEIKIELPIDANLPESYVERADVRLDAYRRLAEVQSLADVDDIEEEWNDRFGAIPEVAQRLLGIARIRAECVRTGVIEVAGTVSTGFGGPPLQVRITPLTLPHSKQMRLSRLYRGSIYKAEARQVQVPIKTSADPLATVLGLFAELVPLEEPSTASNLEQL